MARTPRWTEGAFKAGRKEVRHSGWKWFSDYVNQELLDYTTYIYRGHGQSAWKLEPTLDRIVSSPTSPKREAHLNSFQLATRGRRGANPPAIEDENEWWALGQHHGLPTPLLDWTESPFVALYFAIVSAQKQTGSTCCIWALSQGSARFYSEQITSDDSIKPIQGRKPVVEIVRPMSDENARLVNQRGLFTRGPNNVPVEHWIEEYHDLYTPDDKIWSLIKLTIPKTGAKDCLRYLNRMNINHATLFPDVYGASKFCNMDLQITDY